jgi:hypothetical protein
LLDVDLASNHIVQDVLEIVDELVAQPQSMFGEFESNAYHEEPTSALNMVDEDNDEYLVALRDACQ